MNTILLWHRPVLNMGNHQQKPVVDVHGVRECLSIEQLSAVSVEFSSLRGESKTVSRAQFLTKILYPLLGKFGVRVVDRAYEVLAFKGRDYIDFEEFCTIIYVLRFGGVDERLRLMFKFADLDANGVVSAIEFQSAYTVIIMGEIDDKGKEKAVAPIVAFMTKTVFCDFNKSTREGLVYSEFRRFAETNQFIMDIVRAMMPKVLKMPRLGF